MNSFWQDISLHHNVGIGFKPRYFDNLMRGAHNIGWVEIHAENYMIDGGPIKAQLREVARNFPVTCHGVGLSIGAQEPLDRKHLRRLKTLNDWLQPAIFSEHLAWSTHKRHYLNDLLPLPYTNEVLKIVVQHIEEVQETLGRRMLLENPSTYLTYGAHEMSEVDFINEVVRRSNCGLLLDVNNVYVTATNQHFDPYAYIDALPLDAVGELHLSGHSIDADSHGDRILIDSHDAPVDTAVWALYEHTLSHLGATPTLIEWDSNFPSWNVLAAEAHQAEAAIARLSAPSFGEHYHVAG